MQLSDPTDIIIIAVNARYAHTSFGARYLMANLGGLQSHARMMEFDLQLNTNDAAEQILSGQPQIVSIGCYIWNIEQVTALTKRIKQQRPDCIVILGGPEISYETEQQEIFSFADYVICGEGEVEFPRLCHALLGRRDACGTTDPPEDVPQASRLPEAVPQASRLPHDVPQASRLPESTGFHPYQPIHQTRRKSLPHWTQKDSIYFVTFRLADSIPQSRIKEYKELRRKWEEHHQPPYSKKESQRFNQLFSERVNEWLDRGAGSCYFKKPELSKIVAEALTHFEGERYELDEWVIMPNHVHALIKPLGEHKLADILHSWKSFSAHRINERLGRKGPVWQIESYDHLVRDIDELSRIRNYIHRNPEKAGVHVLHSGCRRDACGTTDAPEGVPQASRLPEDVPQASRLPEDVPQASRLPQDVPQASRLLEDVPQASRLPKITKAAAVDVSTIVLPYPLYSDEDIAHRAIYVEASRGCPFRCEYCMSSLDSCVRYFPEDRFLEAMDQLLQRGARLFKFVDRTFNIDIDYALRILAFFRERYEPGMMLHFEVIPDRLPDALLEAVKQCPSGMLQFEIGIQTFNEAVARRIQRPLDIEKIETNIRRLRQETDVHLHSDLIVGLPGEDLRSFESGFNRLLALHPQEIQLGILKRLRGAPIDRHTAQWKMVYHARAPYEILETSLVSADEMQRMQRFARYWNLIVNSGRFNHTAPLIWQEAPSPFAAFMALSDWLFEQTGITSQLHMLRLAQLLLEYLADNQNLPKNKVGDALLNDYRRGNRPDTPGFLKTYDAPRNQAKMTEDALPHKPGGGARQRRHLT